MLMPFTYLCLEFTSEIHLSLWAALLFSIAHTYIKLYIKSHEFIVIPKTQTYNHKAPVYLPVIHNCVFASLSLLLARWFVCFFFFLILAVTFH